MWVDEHPAMNPNGLLVTNIAAIFDHFSRGSLNTAEDHAGAIIYGEICPHEVLASVNRLIKPIIIHTHIYVFQCGFSY